MAPTLVSSLLSTSSSPAIVLPDSTILSHADIRNAILGLQQDIDRLGLVKPGTAVSISIPNSVSFLMTFVAVTGLRGVAAPLNPSYKEQEVDFYASDTNSVLLIIPEGSLNEYHEASLIKNKANQVTGAVAAIRAAVKLGIPIAEVKWVPSEKRVKISLGLAPKNKKEPKLLVPLPNGTENSRDVHPEDIALVLHTSGTTGRPKAVPLSHRNMSASMRNIRETYKFIPSDRGYLVMPLFHVHGLLCGLLAPLSAGSSVIIPPKFAAHQFWDDFIGLKANWYTAVPTIHQILLKRSVPTDKLKIRFVRSCSSALAPSTLFQLEKAFNAPVLEAYAMTEACHQMTSNPLPPKKHIPASVGFGQGGVSVRILDKDGNEVPRNTDGEISVKGDNVTPGYLNNPKANEESFTKSGYFRTGDQGKMDKNGYVYITGRIKELINRGGEKISPIELDGALLSHPAVAEAVTFGMDDELYGQDVYAAVVLKPDAKNVTEKDLQNFLASRVAKFKVPKRIFFTDSMPKTATGKVQRRVFPAIFESQLKDKVKSKL